MWLRTGKIERDYQKIHDLEGVDVDCTAAWYVVQQKVDAFGFEKEKIGRLSHSASGCH